jgi:hypothetical protein
LLISFRNKNHGNYKHQKPNPKQIPMTKTQNPKQADRLSNIKEVNRMFGSLDFRIWILFGIWDFKPYEVIVNYFNLNGLFSNLTYPRGAEDAA